MFFGMDFDASGTKRKKAICIFAEVEDHIFGMEGTMFRFVDMFAHRK